MKYIIKTNLGYFYPKSNNYLTRNWFKAKRMSKTQINCYFDSICSDISMINNENTKVKIIKTLF